jgi:hypothetical protein
MIIKCSARFYKKNPPYNELKNTTEKRLSDMKKKHAYNSPELELIRFVDNDIVTESPLPDPDEENWSNGIY